MRVRISARPGGGVEGSLAAAGLLPVLRVLFAVFVLLRATAYSLITPEPITHLRSLAIAESRRAGRARPPTPLRDKAECPARFLAGRPWLELGPPNAQRI